MKLRNAYTRTACVLGLLGTTSLLILSGAAQAQAEDGGEQAESKRLGTVTVTAQKREQDLQDVPISVQALGEEQLDQLNIATFDDLKGKRLALYSGYHYGFAGFEADPEYLAHTFDALMTYSHDSNLRMLLARRVDVAVVTWSYLQMFLDRNPQLVPELLVSERVDQQYHHQVLLRPGGVLTPDQVAGMLSELQENGELPALLRRYRLTLAGKVVAD